MSIRHKQTLAVVRPSGGERAWFLRLFCTILLCHAFPQFLPAQQDSGVRQQPLAVTGVTVIDLTATSEDARADEPEYRDDSRLRYVPASRLSGWRRDLTITAQAPAEIREFYDAVFRDAFPVTEMAHGAGVKILVGTDAFDTMVFPGLSYGDEMALLHRAGLPPLAILKAATIEAAAFLGKATEYGTVATGKVADLVLLDADPLLDIRNAARIRAVIFRGAIFDRGALDALLRSAEAFVVLPS